MANPRLRAIHMSGQNNIQSGDDPHEPPEATAQKYFSAMAIALGKEH